jgi:hypothetical protein
MYTVSTLRLHYWRMAAPTALDDKIRQDANPLQHYLLTISTSGGSFCRSELDLSYDMWLSYTLLDD